MQLRSRAIVSVAFILGVCFTICANPAGKEKKKTKKEDIGTTITLVTSGTGSTKEEATANALRSALEQTYGTFVSSNTKVVNDDLVKDEIISISTGNIVSYEVLSYLNTTPNQVTVKSVVSITRLAQYAQNKGMSAELAGNTFAMNLKMEELNKLNEYKALEHLSEQTQLISKSIFDYELWLGNPQKKSMNVQIPIRIYIKANSNTLSYYELFHNTLSGLAINKDYKKRAKRVAEPLSRNHLTVGIGVGRDEDPSGVKFEERVAIGYILRADGYEDEQKTNRILFSIQKLLEGSVWNCEVVDNLGNISGFKFEKGINSEQFKWGSWGLRFEPYLTNKFHVDESGWCNLFARRKALNDDNKRGRSIECYPAQGIRLDVYFQHWLGSVKPLKGETLYEISLFLTYSIDEISKISKIAIKPKMQ